MFTAPSGFIIAEKLGNFTASPGIDPMIIPRKTEVIMKIRFCNVKTLDKMLNMNDIVTSLYLNQAD